MEEWDFSEVVTKIDGMLEMIESAKEDCDNLILSEYSVIAKKLLLEHQEFFADFVMPYAEQLKEARADIISYTEEDLNLNFDVNAFEEVNSKKHDMCNFIMGSFADFGNTLQQISADFYDNLAIQKKLLSELPQKRKPTKKAKKVKKVICLPEPRIEINTEAGTSQAQASLPRNLSNLYFVDDQGLIEKDFTENIQDVLSTAERLADLQIQKNVTDYIIPTINNLPTSPPRDTQNMSNLIISTVAETATENIAINTDAAMPMPLNIIPTINILPTSPPRDTQNMSNLIISTVAETATENIAIIKDDAMPMPSKDLSPKKLVDTHVETNIFINTGEQIPVEQHDIMQPQYNGMKIRSEFRIHERDLIPITRQEFEEQHYFEETQFNTFPHRLKFKSISKLPQQVKNFSHSYTNDQGLFKEILEMLRSEYAPLGSKNKPIDETSNIHNKSVNQPVLQNENGNIEDCADTIAPNNNIPQAIEENLEISQRRISQKQNRSSKVNLEQSDKNIPFENLTDQNSQLAELATGISEIVPSICIQDQNNQLAELAIGNVSEIHVPEICQQQGINILTEKPSLPIVSLELIDKNNDQTKNLNLSESLGALPKSAIKPGEKKPLFGNLDFSKCRGAIPKNAIKLGKEKPILGSDNENYLNSYKTLKDIHKKNNYKNTITITEIEKYFGSKIIEKAKFIRYLIDLKNYKIIKLKTINGKLEEIIILDSSISCLESIFY